MSRSTTPLGALTSAFILAMALGGTMSPPPAFADESPPPTTVSSTTTALPDLQISAEFNRHRYDPRDEIGVVVTVRNVGTAPATGVHVSFTTNVTWGPWGALNDPIEQLQPGHIASSLNSGVVANADQATEVSLRIAVRADQEDANPADNTLTITAPLILVRGGFSGVVYGDQNGNHTMEPSEALSGALVTLFVDPPFDVPRQTTDSDGRFSFQEVPAGTYEISFQHSGAWYFPPIGEITIDAVDDPDIVVRAVPVVVPNVTATLAFTRTTYTSGDTAHLNLTLTNGDPTPLSQVTAQRCTGIDPAGPGFGDLAHGAAGVTIPGGSTRSLDISSTVPPEAMRLGYLEVECLFGPPSEVPDIGVDVRALVKVVGGFAPSVRGRLGVPHQIGMFDPVPNTKIYLRDKFTGTIAARATTDGHGSFEFTNVPAGLYLPGVVGPWDTLGQVLHVVAGGSDPMDIIVTRSSVDHPDPDPSPQPQPPAAGAPPTPQPGVVPARLGTGGGTGTGGLASTGADVLWLTVGGLLMLAAGALLVLRRRRPSPATRRIPRSPTG
jgi:LPXTG-motif cell wall-anchored protein